jgi:hypothetical protein
VKAVVKPHPLIAAASRTAPAILRQIGKHI